MARQRISRALSAEPIGSESGFTLIEIVCVLAIIGLLAAIILPAIPRATSKSKLEAYAVATAALLKADHNAAIWLRAPVAAQVSVPARRIRSGATGRIVQLPDDVLFETILASRCANHPTGNTIDFLPSGMSCGGVLAFSRPGVRYEVRVNWLTGGVEIVAPLPL